jgi:hypothetical protein
MHRVVIKNGRIFAIKEESFHHCLKQTGHFEDITLELTKMLGAVYLWRDGLCRYQQLSDMALRI